MSLRFTLPLKLIEKIFNYEITLGESVEDQISLEILINKLKHDYKPRNEQKKKQRKKGFRICK